MALEFLAVGLIVGTKFRLLRNDTLTVSGRNLEIHKSYTKRFITVDAFSNFSLDIIYRWQASLQE